MWVWLSLFSAVLLGLYDVAKKQALERNGVLWVLFSATALSTLFLVPFMSHGSSSDHFSLVLKAFLVTTSWVSGLAGMSLLPLTTASTIKGSRPIFVVLFSIVLFRERLNWMQWAGVGLAVTALLMLSWTSRKEGDRTLNMRGFVYMGISVLSGVASAIFDKHIIEGMQPLFVQSWSNFYITIMLALCLVARRFFRAGGCRGFRWDWTLVLIAVLITSADFLYFFALKSDGALLSVISLIRRGAVIVTFVGGAILFKERHVREKAIAMAVMFSGVVMLLLGS